MTVLDCADPSMQVARRNETLSALQALSLLNNSLMLVMAKQFAVRVEQGGGDAGLKVRRAFHEAMGRSATADEVEALTRYAEGNGLPNLCRVLFNLNEFVFVD